MTTEPAEPVEPAAAAGAGATDNSDATDEGSFRAFGLSDPLLRALKDLGYEGPTPVQRDTIRVMMDGRDVIVQAQTGTGKTAAYGIPLVERADTARRRPQALVLAPTRELAVQVAEALHDFGKYRRLQVLPIYGGAPYERQLRGLREGVQIVVGTPGRLLDHLRRGTLDLSEIRVAILDEADEMLNMGFLDDVEAILAAIAAARVTATTAREAAAGDKAETEADGVAEGAPPEAPRVQLALFSATMPAPVERLARRFLKDAKRIDISPGQVTVPQIDQVAYEIGSMNKVDALARVLDVEIPGSAIVFCATRRAVDDVADRLSVRGYRSAGLHGDMTQGERERVLRRFREGQVEVLVATDVAARGLDIETVTHVVNFDVPWDPELYVHRIGRTGRAGRAGDAITLVTPRDFRLMRVIEQVVKQRIDRKRLPSLADVATRRREAAKDAVVGAITGGDLDAYLTLAGELGDQHDPIEVAAAALRLWDQARSSAADGTTLAGALSAAEQETRLAPERPAGRSSAEARRAASEFEADGLAPEAGMSRLFVDAGRVDGLRPQDLVGAIANEAGLRGRDIGNIDIYDRFSFVEVPAAHVDRIIQALSTTTIRGRTVEARPAQPGLDDKNLPASPRGRPAADRPDRGARDRRPPDGGFRRAPEAGGRPRHARRAEEPRPTRARRTGDAESDAAPPRRRPGFTARPRVKLAGRARREDRRPDYPG